MKPKACLVVFCNRTTRDVICGRCWRLVSAETKLALEDQGRLWTSARAAHDELAEFLSWSYWSTMRAAAHESYNARAEIEEARTGWVGFRSVETVLTTRERRGTKP